MLKKKKIQIISILFVAMIFLGLETFPGEEKVVKKTNFISIEAYIKTVPSNKKVAVYNAQLTKRYAQGFLNSVQRIENSNKSLAYLENFSIESHEVYKENIDFIIAPLLEVKTQKRRNYEITY